MREIRSSGSVGELPGNRWLYPEQPFQLCFWWRKGDLPTGQSRDMGEMAAIHSGLSPKP